MSCDEALDGHTLSDLPLDSTPTSSLMRWPDPGPLKEWRTRTRARAPSREARGGAHRRRRHVGR